MGKAFRKGDGPINCETGDEFQIQLEANPTTGFVWRVVSVGSIIEVNEEHFQPTSGNVGSAGLQTFSLRSLKPGTAKLRFEYVQPWEGHPENQCVFEINVKKAPS
jgi:predicted secreted protein